MKKIVSKKIFLFILISFSTFKIYSCSCDITPFQQALEYADEIFVGKIVKAEKYKNGIFINENNEQETNWDWRFYFEVTKKWKGNNKSTLIVHHQGDSCDLYFDIYEREYLVYASRELGKENFFGITIGPTNGKKKLTTWLCSRTIYNKYWEKDNWFEKDIEKLNKEFSTPIKLSNFSVDWKYVFLIFFILVGILFFIRKKRKPTAI